LAAITEKWLKELTTGSTQIRTLIKPQRGGLIGAAMVSDTPLGRSNWES